MGTILLVKFTNHFEAMQNLHYTRNLAFMCLARASAVMLLGLASLLTGCEGTLFTTRQLGTAPPETSVASLGVEALAYGRVRWIENSQERTTYKSALGWNIWPKYLRIEDMQSRLLGVETDGTFTWRLPRGIYILQQIHWFDAWAGPHRLLPQVAFQIPDGAHAYCLGTLVIDLKGKRDIIGGLWVKGWKIHIEDDCGHIASQFRSRYTDPDLRLAKSLMIYDPRIPDRPEQLEELDRVDDFIRAIMPGLMTIP